MMVQKQRPLRFEQLETGFVDGETGELGHRIRE